MDKAPNGNWGFWLVNKFKSRSKRSAASHPVRNKDVERRWNVPILRDGGKTPEMEYWLKTRDPKETRVSCPRATRENTKRTEWAFWSNWESVRTLRCSFASGRSSPVGGFLTPSFSLRETHTFRNVFFGVFYFFEGRSKNHHRVFVMLIYREAQPLLRSSACARLWVSWASPLIKVRPKCFYMYTCDLGFGFTA